MRRLLFLTHPDVEIDPGIPVTGWHLSPAGAERMRRFAAGPEVARIAAIWSSAEAKAREAALGIVPEVDPALGENDRSATGYLPREDFEAMAEAFFARPEESVAGWERAVDAQARIRAAVGRIAAGAGAGDVAVVSHGAVGTLLLCALGGRAIRRAEDQPFREHFFAATLPGLRPIHGWRAT